MSFLFVRLWYAVHVIVIYKLNCSDWIGNTLNKELGLPHFLQEWLKSAPGRPEKEKDRVESVAKPEGGERKHSDQVHLTKTNSLLSSSWLKRIDCFCLSKRIVQSGTTPSMPFCHRSLCRHHHATPANPPAITA